MSANPIEIALREIAGTRHLLERLIQSSESFDYPQAKAALRELQDKIRRLGKLEAQMSTLRAQPSGQILRFPLAATFEGDAG